MTMKISSRKLSVILCLVPALYFAFSTAYALANFGLFASETPQFIRYVAVPGALALAFLALAVFFSAKIGIAAGTNALAVLAALFAVEAVLTAGVFVSFAGLLGIGSPAPAENKKVVAQNYLVKGVNNALGIKELRSALLGGIPRELVLLCSKDGKRIVYTADRFGFNNPDSLYDGQVDNIIVGDSFIEGMCLEPGKDVVSQLRKSYPASSAMGTRGSGPLQELAIVGRFGPVLKPRNVIVAFFEGNDWENLSNEFKIPWLQEALEPGTDFGSQAVPPVTLEKARGVIRDRAKTPVTYWDILWRTELVRNFVALQQVGTALGVAYPKAALPQPIYRDVLARANETTRSWGGKLTLIYIPRVDRYKGILPRDFVFDQVRSQVLSAATDLKIDVIDLVALFQQDPDPRTLYAGDAHLSDRGAAVVAQAIVEYFRSALPTAWLQQRKIPVK
jgi:hypothetical protein